MAMQLLNQARDVQGIAITSLNIRTNAPLKFSSTLAAATEATFTVPSSFDNWVAFFKYEGTANVWVSVNATATVPAGATFAATASSLRPEGLKLQAGDVVHVITADASTDIGVDLFPLNLN